jgi:dihydrodipicolinate synthase/N-acetylneuraminate lyase
MVTPIKKLDKDLRQLVERQEVDIAIFIASQPGEQFAVLTVGEHDEIVALLVEVLQEKDLRAMLYEAEFLRQAILHQNKVPEDTLVS